MTPIGKPSSLLLVLGSLVLATPLAAAQAPAPAPEPEFVKVGETLPPFEATGVDGAVRAVKYEKPTVLVFFLSGCPSCHKMIPEWNQAFDRKPKGLEMVGVLMDREPPGFFTATPVTFPVVRAPSREFGRIFKVERVPITLRVGVGGKVEDVSVGILDRIRVGQFFRP